MLDREAYDRMAALIEPLLTSDLPGLRSIRIGTKALTFRPQRFVTDAESDALLRLVERLAKSGRNLAVTAHVNHWREPDHPLAQTAVRRLQDAGATIHSQAPLLAGINDDAGVWARNWHELVRMGIHRYCVFVERDTGPRRYFEVPLARGLQIYRSAIRRVSGLARSVGGPAMSVTRGMVELLAVESKGDTIRYLLQFLQARDAAAARPPFWATGPSDACWFDALTPEEGGATHHA